MQFKYCPNCASDSIEFDDIKKYSCPDCGLEYYHNTASAVIAILVYKGKIVFTIRNQNPSKGCLDLPGGFSDPDETAEEAVRREVKEELSVELEKIEYLGTFPNTYFYKDFQYTTCDVVYVSEISELPYNIEKEEISEIRLISPTEIPFDEIPFNSIKCCLSEFIKTVE